MKPELNSLIRQFRDAQDIAVSAITQTLGIPLPKSGRDWVRYCCDTGLQKLRELNGISIFAHGFGIELSIGNVKIDFDWGPSGEPDGFDAWRLYNFALDNETGVRCAHYDVIQWIDHAFANHELERIDHMYFDPNRRAVAARVFDEPDDALEPRSGTF